jgi:hypothetical protein
VCTQLTQGRYRFDSRGLSFLLFFLSPPTWKHHVPRARDTYKSSELRLSRPASTADTECYVQLFFCSTPSRYPEIYIQVIGRTFISPDQVWQRGMTVCCVSWANGWCRASSIPGVIFFSFCPFILCHRSMMILWPNRTNRDSRSGSIEFNPRGCFFVPFAPCYISSTQPPEIHI